MLTRSERTNRWTVSHTNFELNKHLKILEGVTRWAGRFLFINNRLLSDHVSKFIQKQRNGNKIFNEELLNELTGTEGWTWKYDEKKNTERRLIIILFSFSSKLWVHVRLVESGRKSSIILYELHSKKVSISYMQFVYKREFTIFCKKSDLQSFIYLFWYSLAYHHQ